MRRPFPFIVILLVGIPAVAHTADVNDGTCSPPSAESGLAMMGDVVAQAAQVARNCVPPNASNRSMAEREELARTVDRYEAWMRDACSFRMCLSNAWAVIADSNLGLDFGSRVLAGCGMWASEGSTALMDEPIRYWTMREVKFGDGALVGDGFHWVVELRNTRTGETVYLDGWNAASKARSWEIWRGAEAAPKRMRRKDMVRNGVELQREWGALVGGYGCLNTTVLCDADGCRVIKP